uniref:Uncharacterized protein n=1 Tax=Marmota marmota marmota TaxID=9994 RepID=A0A8C5Z8Z6_MARMA
MEAGGFPWGSPGPAFRQEQWEDLSEQPVCVQGVLSLTASLCLLFSVWCHLSRLMERDGRFADEHAERRAGGLLDFMVPNEDTRQEEVQPREMGTEDPPPIGRQPGTRPALRFLKCQSPASAQRTPHQKTGGRQVALCGMRNLAEHVKGEPAPPGMTTAPLALEHMILTHRVVVSSCPSSDVALHEIKGQMRVGARAGELQGWEVWLEQGPSRGRF